ncbi:MAG: class I fructose-bisphosphate aldolase, partial [Candidatus Thorarchaeota archaeon]
VLKINGKTRIPPADEPVSPMTGSVEDAVRIGADAIGYTLYVGSPNQHTDFTQFRKVKKDAERYGIPIIVWAYPRGSAVDKKGGRDSLFAVDYAAREGRSTTTVRQTQSLHRRDGGKSSKICR